MPAKVDEFPEKVHFPSKNIINADFVFYKQKVWSCISGKIPKRGEEAKAVWTFSENLSILAGIGFPKSKAKNLMTLVKLFRGHA